MLISRISTFCSVFALETSEVVVQSTKHSAHSAAIASMDGQHNHICKLATPAASLMQKQRKLNLFSLSNLKNTK